MCESTRSLAATCQNIVEHVIETDGKQSATVETVLKPFCETTMQVLDDAVEKVWSSKELLAVDDGKYNALIAIPVGDDAFDLEMIIIKPGCIGRAELEDTIDASTVEEIIMIL